MSRNRAFQGITLFDLLPDGAQHVDLLDCVDEPISELLPRLQIAIDEQAQSALLGTWTDEAAPAIPTHHEASELAYELLYRLDHEINIKPYRAVAFFVSCVLDQKVTESAVKKAWQRSL